MSISISPSLIVGMIGRSVPDARRLMTIERASSSSGEKGIVRMSSTPRSNALSFVFRSPRRVRPRTGVTLRVRVFEAPSRWSSAVLSSWSMSTTVMCGRHSARIASASARLRAARTTKTPWFSVSLMRSTTSGRSWSTSARRASLLVRSQDRLSRLILDFRGIRPPRPSLFEPGNHRAGTSNKEGHQGPAPPGESSAVRRSVETSPHAGHTATAAPIRSSCPSAPANPHPQRSWTSKVSASSVESARLPPSVSIRNACCRAGSGMLDAWRTRTSSTRCPPARRSHWAMSSATSETSCMVALRDRLGTQICGSRGHELGHGVDDPRECRLEHG